MDPERVAHAAAAHEGPREGEHEEVVRVESSQVKSRQAAHECPREGEHEEVGRVESSQVKSRQAARRASGRACRQTKLGGGPACHRMRWAVTAVTELRRASGPSHAHRHRAGPSDLRV